MYFSLDKTIDITTGLYLGLMSVATMGVCKKTSQTLVNGANSGCHLSGLSRATVKTGVSCGMVAGALYLYRGLRR